MLVSLGSRQQARVHLTKLCDPVGLRALTVLRFNFKVELEAAMED
jgi:hypothetical protein